MTTATEVRKDVYVYRVHLDHQDRARVIGAGSVLKIVSFLPANDVLVLPLNRWIVEPVLLATVRANAFVLHHQAHALEQPHELSSPALPDKTTSIKVVERIGRETYLFEVNNE